MVNLYKEITAHADQMYADGFQEELENLGALDIFAAIFKAFPDPMVAKKTVLYILYCYSEESNLITVGGDRMTEKGEVYRKLNFPYKDDKENRILYDQIVNLESVAVITCAQTWMEKKNKAAFNYYLTLKDSYAEMQRAALLPLLKGGGEIDYDQKQKCIEYMGETRKLIKEAEQGLVQNDPKLKIAHQELKSSKVEHKYVGPETYSKSPLQ